MTPSDDGQKIPFRLRLPSPSVTAQDGGLQEGGTPCPAVPTHLALDARDGWEHCLEYKFFTGEYNGCTKEADLTIIPRLGPDWTKEAQYPSVVLESGLSEPAQQLDRDASLWLAGSGGQVRVVVQVKFYRRQDRIGARVWIKRARPTYNSSFKISIETYEILPPAVDPVENPSITFEEFFAGGGPPGLDPKGYVILNLENLRILARMRIIMMNKFVPAVPVAGRMRMGCLRGCVTTVVESGMWQGGFVKQCGSRRIFFGAFKLYSGGTLSRATPIYGNWVFHTANPLLWRFFVWQTKAGRHPEIGWRHPKWASEL